MGRKAKDWITFEFANGDVKRFPWVGEAQQYANENNTRIVRQY